MRHMRTTILAGAAALLAAGTAVAAAAKTNHMDVSLPDGSTLRVEYAGDAPKVTVEPAERRTVALRPVRDPFAEFDRIAAAMQARHQAMMRHMAALQNSASRVVTAAPGRMTLVGNLPAGARFTMVSTTTDANGCTRTVEVRSDGSTPEPKRTEVSSGKCDGVQRQERPDPAPAPAPAAKVRVPNVVA